VYICWLQKAKPVPTYIRASLTQIEDSRESLEFLIDRRVPRFLKLLYRDIIFVIQISIDVFYSLHVLFKLSLKTFDEVVWNDQ